MVKDLRRNLDGVESRNIGPTPVRSTDDGNSPRRCDSPQVGKQQVRRHGSATDHHWSGPGQLRDVGLLHFEVVNPDDASRPADHSTAPARTIDRPDDRVRMTYRQRQSRKPGTRSKIDDLGRGWVRCPASCEGERIRYVPDGEIFDLVGANPTETHALGCQPVLEGLEAGQRGRRQLEPSPLGDGFEHAFTHTKESSAFTDVPRESSR